MSICLRSGRAYPGSEFVVANTLAKWKKFEPNEINLSQGFSQKVLTSCFVSYSLSAMSADNLCKQFGPRSLIRLNKMSGLIWIQTVGHLDGIKIIQHPKSKIWHNDEV